MNIKSVYISNGLFIDQQHVQTPPLSPLEYDVHFFLFLFQNNNIPEGGTNYGVVRIASVFGSVGDLLISLKCTIRHTTFYKCAIT